MIELKIKDNLTLVNAVQKYGANSQCYMAIEEMSELIKALCNYHRGREANIAEEIADVYIMLQQLQIIFNNGIEIQDWIDNKVERLKERIGE